MIAATVAIILGIILAIMAGNALYRLPTRVIRMNPDFTRANRRKGKAKITDRQLQLLIDWTPISLTALERFTGRTEVELVERVQAQWDRNTNGGEWTEKDEQDRLDMVARVQAQWDRNLTNKGE